MIRAPINSKTRIGEPLIDNWRSVLANPIGEPCAEPASI